MKKPHVPEQSWPTDAVSRVPIKAVPKSVLRNGVKDCTCADCGVVWTVRKDTHPTVCQRCAAARGGRAILGKTTAERKPCVCCGAPIRATTGQTYCSIECRKKDKRTERTCMFCHKQFAVLKSAISSGTNASGNFCSRPCYEQWLCRTDKETDRGSRWKNIRAEVLKSAPFCAMCGTTKGLQVHHIIPWRLSHDNNKRNLVPLCVKHHRLVESIFVSTEEFGIGDAERLLWRSMIMERQMATATVLRGIVRDRS